MMRNWWKMYCGVIAVAIIAMAATTALASPGLLVNSDMENQSRFGTHGVPGVDHPNGYADGWHHSQNAAWSGTVGGPMSVSPTHSLYIPDTSANGREEMRSFATPLPGTGVRTLDMNWKWKWNKTAGDLFSATVRISTDPVGSLDLGGPITDHVFLTDGSALSSGGTGGFEMKMVSIPLTAADKSFDIIFRTTANPNGSQGELGTMWVDDVFAAVPEPATMGLLGLGGLGLMMVSRRRRS